MIKGYGFYYSKAMRSLTQVRWMLPYLLVPPMLALLVYTEGFLAAEGIPGIYTLHQRSVLALWNISFLISLITGISSCCFFSGFWGDSDFVPSLSRFSKKISGYWSPVFAFISISAVVYFLASALIVLVLPGSEHVSLIRIGVHFFAPVLWSVCIGVLLGLLTTGWAGSVCFTVLFLFFYFLGLTYIPASGSMLFVTLLPPIGLLMKEAFSNTSIEYLFSIILLIHCLVILGAGRILYTIALRRS